ncbi:type IX secretion system sortase PorU [Flexithrix dorotheae]|uniref:type IX secretion system sortase PorU n=1 Tax=Flexithrix dorotheae TaxID=70993 RepID=UPI000374EC6F|nr:type IX secretion system sortase PorU [Flexithrix dorotheae]
MRNRLLLLFGLLLLSGVGFSQEFANTSVLAEGEIYKIGITENGIYKIDVEFLNTLGVNASSIDPENVKVYGNGGGILPQANASFRYDDLVENPTLKNGGGDGNFQNGDYILFYAEGSDKILFDTLNNQISHQKNIYADTNYYFIEIANTRAKDLEDVADLGGGALEITSFDDYVYHEEETYNIIKAGKRWFGEKFDFLNEMEFEFQLEGALKQYPVKVSSSLMSTSPSASSFSLTLNGFKLPDANIAATAETQYGIKGRINNVQETIPEDKLNLESGFKAKLTYNKTGNSVNHVGYLDYIGVNFKRDLKLYSNLVQFRNFESLSVDKAAFKIKGGGEATVVWDISNPVNPKNQLFSLSGNDVIFSTETKGLKEFIAFSGSGFPNPISIGKINNQNLHGLTTPNLIIISYPKFEAEAQRLAEFRRNHDGLTVEVVTPPQIYNEFSSGKQDISAIRDFLRMLYLRNSDQESGLRYVLLFGDGSFDYKDKMEKGTSPTRNTNFIPVYESDEPLHPIYSYSSDDFYGFLDEDEGDWSEKSTDVIHNLELGIGRLPIGHVSEAKNLVDKLINYATNELAIGDWKKEIVFVADDGDNNTHQIHADRLARLVESKYQQFDVNRLFIDDYPQITSTTNGKRISPIVREKINEFVDKGTLIVNYTGHGSENGWSKKDILGLNQIVEWDNFTRMPLFVTATCEFGRFDSPFTKSGAEFALLNPRGGAIGLLTTTRPVFSNTNFTVNQAFFNTVFEPYNGRKASLGDIIRITKNNSISGVNNRNFTLLGDPSMQLAYSNESVVVKKVNDIELTESDTIKALSTVKLSGEIQNSDVLSQDFNGTLYVKVLDKKTTKTTLGEDGSHTKMNYQTFKDMIFRGEASVVDGKFEFSFVIPKDISYQFDYGKISFYAKHATELRDASGHESKLVIGGSETAFEQDNTPPDLQLYLDNESFESGGIVNTDAELIVKLFDENGINSSGISPGHDIEMILDDETRFVLNSYYQAEKDDYKNGKINFPLNNIEPGEHTLWVKAWDTHNNSSQTEISFYVTAQKEVVLSDVINHPNPFKEQTEFSFSHNRAGEEIDVTIFIYDQNGKLVKELQHEIPFATEDVNNIQWNRSEDINDNFKSGIYFYKLYIYLPKDGTSSSKGGKFVITD